MTVLVGLLRIPGFIVVTGLYILACFLGTLFIRTGRVQRAFLSRVTSMGSRIALGIFNIRFTVEGAERRLGENANWLAAANHVSFLDILILSSIYRSLYITSVEVQKTFFLA
jgi:1-acyl-sn-glycerol-3-phosphate acyltransferase